MEAAIANLMAPGDKILVGINGIWGQRVSDMAGRFGGVPIDLHAPLGAAFSYKELKAALEQHKPQLLFLCQVR